MGPVDVYLESQSKDNHGSEPPSSFPSSSGFYENIAAYQGASSGKKKNVMAFARILIPGITKIVPFHVDTSADYSLLTYAGISVTDMWSNEDEWDEFGALHDDYGIANVSTPRPQTPPSNPPEAPPANNSTG